MVHAVIWMGTFLVVLFPLLGVARALTPEPALQGPRGGGHGRAVCGAVDKGGTLKTTIASSAPIGTNGQGSYQWTNPLTKDYAAVRKVRVKGGLKGLT